MALPQALQDANEKANELIRQQSEGQKSTPDTGNTEDPKPQAQQPQENRTPEQAQQPQQSDSEQAWEHKYRVLQGKYNADTTHYVDPCSRCASGTYSRVKAATSCQDCPDGSSSPAGSTAQSDCTGSSVEAANASSAPGRNIPALVSSLLAGIAGALLI